MSTLALSLLSLAACLPLFQLATAHTILHRQCWHEHPLQTVEVQSSLGGLQELISIRGAITSTKANTYAPWTHAPTCTPFLPGLSSKLCVYSNASFANGRGISIVTTPSLAAQFAALPAFKVRPADQINTFSETWTTSAIPGKGMGMLASRSLDPKTRVLAYTPVLLAYLESELDTMEREKLWRVAIEQLPEQARSQFLDLAVVFGDPRVKVQDVVKANTFQVVVGDGNHLAVWPETSRLNHECAPNAQYVIDPDLLTHTVHVMRPIAEGEEITIAYTSPLELTEHRQSHLQNGFHFTCTCNRCTNSEVTDSTLEQMNTLQAQLNDWSSSSSASPAMAEKLLQMYKDEGLDGFVDIPYGFTALSYNAVGEIEEAKKYALLARESVLLKDGKNAGSLGIWREIIEGAEKHWSYRRRVA